MPHKNQELEILSNVADEVRRSSRRGFLTKAAITSAAVVPATLLGRQVQAGYQGGSVDQRATAQNFVEIRAHENSHAEFLMGALGGMARPEPTFKNLLAGNYGQFISMSTAFENLGVHAYLGALPRIANPSYVFAAGSIALTEAYHAGFLNTLSNAPLTPDGAFTQPMSIPNILQAISPYVAGINGGPPLNFSEAPSAQNDVDILNFALALEFLERAFYNMNVSRFF